MSLLEKIDNNFKFCGLRTIVGLVYLLPSYDWAFVGILWVPNFSCRYIMCPKHFLEGILWVQNFLSWIFRGYKFFSRGFFVGTKYWYFVGILWVQMVRIFVN